MASDTDGHWWVTALVVTTALAVVLAGAWMCWRTIKKVRTGR